MYCTNDAHARRLAMATQAQTPAQAVTWEERGLPLRRGYYGRYLFNLPDTNVLEVHDSNGARVAGARIEVFQHTDPILTRYPFSTVYSQFPNVAGNNGVLVIRVTYGQGKQAYRFLDLPRFNLQVAQGHADEAVYVIEVP